MTRAEFRSRVHGRTIIHVKLPEIDRNGRAEPDGQYPSVLIESITLDDGTKIELSGSPQIEIADVWAELTR